MIPTVTRTTEEMIRLVPQSYREAGLALGIPQWKTTVRIVLPTAMKGITTGILLALARAAGETAPLLFTALGNRFWSTSVAAADRVADRVHLRLCQGALRRLEPAGVGGRVCPDRPDLRPEPRCSVL